MKDIKKIVAGLMVETDKYQQQMKLISPKKISDIDVDVSPNSTLNTTKGVVVCWDLLNYTEDEIASKLALQGIIACL